MRCETPVIVDVVRTPFGKGRPTGVLAGIHPVDLLAEVLEQLVSRSGIDPVLIDDVIAGNSLPVAEQSGNIARHALLAAGLPEEVPGVSIDRKCGSFQQALHFAAQGVAAGAYDAVIACGVEMMSTVPMRTNRMGKDDLGPRFRQRYEDSLVSQGVAAELIAARWEIPREELDEFALRSHRRADRARAEGRLTERIIPIRGAGGELTVEDEGIRPSTTSETLGALPAAFRDETVGTRFPQIDWRVTAGNSSPVSDGAAATLVVSRSLADKLGLEPLAQVTGYAAVGSDPHLMLTGPIPATRKILERHALTVDDIDAFEVSEAFSSVVLAWSRELGVELDRVNRDGGAIAYGHPIGASGGRLLVGLVEAIESGASRAVMTMCEAGGMANATLLESP